MSTATAEVRAVRPASALTGTLDVPSDKSISHRAVLFNSLAAGAATVANFLPGEDCRATIAALRQLGVTAEFELTAPGAATVHLSGPGLTGWAEPDNVIDCQNSGTTMRLLSGAVAGRPFLTVLTGDDSLRSRPMRRVIDPLTQLGATVWGRAGDTRAPLAIRGGSLRGITHETPVASAQVKSAILLAGLSAAGPTTVIEPSLSRDHSERLLAALGARLDREMLPDGRHRVTIWPLEETGPLTPRDLTVPADISSAAFWLVAGLCHPRARLTLPAIGVNPSRTGLLDVLQAMGGKLLLANERDAGGEPVADITVETSDLRGTEVGGALIPRLVDEVPALAVAACFASGRTVIRDAAELRVKESDRIATLSAELTKLGARITEQKDGLTIEGTGRLAGNVRVESHGDHRLAMALAVAGLLADGPVEIGGAEAVAVSYPGFWEVLDALTSGAPNAATAGHVGLTAVE